MQSQNSFFLSLVIWVFIGSVIGYFVYSQNESRVDWPVAFSSKNDFEPIQLYPTDARITRDWSQVGGDYPGRDAREYRFAVWLDVDYTYSGTRHSSSVKYAHRMSSCGAESNAHWAMQSANWPIEAYVNKHDPQILTTSLYYADRAMDIYIKNFIIGGFALAWLFSPLYLAFKK